MKNFAPSWQMICAANAVLAALCSGLAMIGGPSWLGMLNAALGGMAISNVVLITIVVIPMRRAVNEISVAFEAMCECNNSIIAWHEETDNAARIHPAEREDRTLH
jgi:hypothetical protein